MKILRYIPLVFLFLLLGYTPAVGLAEIEAQRYAESLARWQENLEGVEYVHDEIIVELQDMSVFQSMDPVLSEGYALKDIFWHRPVMVFRSTGSRSVAEALARFEGVPGVKAVYPNIKRHVAFIPNDPLYIRQEYHITNHTPDAWDINTGSPAVNVAIIDTGVDVEHPEFTGRIVYTKNFFDPEIIGESNVFDDSGHGTGVTGIIAARGNNADGIAGMAWDVRIMAFRACGGVNLECSIADEIQAIDSAVAHGADVINLSLGGVGTNSLETQAVKDAYNAGVVIVAASGNGDPGKIYVATGNTITDNANMYFPAAFPEVIGVAALNNANGAITDPKIMERAGFSNYGEDIVSVAAVGTAVETSTPYRPTSQVPFAIYTSRNYARLSGTSFACPQVSGAAALLLSHFPDLSPLEVRLMLEQNAVDLGGPDLDGNNVDDYLGHGALDIGAAIGAGASKNSIHENEHFIVGISPSPLFPDDIYIVARCKTGCTTAPYVSYFIQSTLENASVIMQPLPAYSNTYLGRFQTHENGIVTIQVSWADFPQSYMTFIYDLSE